ncbi:MAG TPA: CHAT domain-containing protein, partial [Armatimonadota bacterium]|nr:CHAT domain-containing protein [Armatimonadota bacterium]
TTPPPAPSSARSPAGTLNSLCAALMQALCRHWVAGDSSASALRKAKLELLERPETAAPFHWAAFVLIEGPSALGEDQWRGGVTPSPHSVTDRRCCACRLCHYG